MDLDDGSLSEWTAFAPGPSIVGTEFTAYSSESGVIEGRESSDLEFEVWIAWHGHPPRIYVGVSRLDDVHLPGASPPNLGNRCHTGVMTACRS